MEELSKNPKETRKLAVNFVKKILHESKHKNAFVVGLEGELGAGKTTFTQGLAKALGIRTKTTSPTFVLMKKYVLPKPYGKQLFKNLYHIDAYRLTDHRDLEALGIKDLLKDSENIILIEWSDRIKKILPPKYALIHIDHSSQKERKINITRP